MAVIIIDDFQFQSTNKISDDEPYLVLAQLAHSLLRRIVGRWKIVLENNLQIEEFYFNFSLILAVFIMATAMSATLRTRIYNFLFHSGTKPIYSLAIVLLQKLQQKT